MDNLRDTYIQELICIASEDERIVCLDADSKEATHCGAFAETYPERAFSFGISEQDMVSAAAGMATAGLQPWVNSYSQFITARALDQVINSVAYPNLDVKFVLSHSGLDVGVDGVTHQILNDVAILRSIPNIKLLHPADAIEMRQMVQWAVEVDGPVIIKSGKSPVPEVHDKDDCWKYGYPDIIRFGCGDAVIFCTGTMIEKALEAYVLLEEWKIQPGIVNMSSLTDVKPELIYNFVQNCSFVITLENHSIYGGMGSMICEILSRYRPTKVIQLGTTGFCQAGTPDELYREYGMDAEAIVKVLRKEL